MKFKIDLNTYPGAPYFTVQEYAKAFDKMPQKSRQDMRKAELLLRDLFLIPKSFKLTLHDLSLKKNLLDQFKTLVVQDDPESGVCSTINELASDRRPTVLDVSYTFPQQITNVAKYDAVFIDPNASLGIPVGFGLLFSIKEVQSTFLGNETIEFDRHVFVLRKVLEDYHSKGLDLLVRESNYKAVVLFHLIDTCKYIQPVTERKNRSKTMITGACDISFIQKLELMGYKMATKRHKEKVIITIANYPTHSKELIEMFSDRIALL